MEQNLQGFRLSPHQEHLWAFRMADPDAPYVALCEVEISGALDRARLAAALARVVERHEILRTSFRQVPGLVLPLQVIEGEAPVELPGELATTPWDPSQGAPLRAALADLGGSRHSLLLALSALCADARTLSLLVAEIAREYAGGEGGGDQEGPIQYVDIAEWHASLLEAEESLDGKKHWHRLGFLDGLDAALPFELRGHRGDGRFEPRTFPLVSDAGVMERVEGLARQAGVPPATVLLGAWHVLLRRLTARTGLVVGLSVDGRKFEEMRDALGPCARHLPLLCETVDDEPFSGLVARLGETQAWVGEWQEYFDWREVPGAGGTPRSFPFCFEAGDVAGPWTGAGVTFSIVRRHAFTEPFLLRLSVFRWQGGFAAEVQYDAGALAPEQAERLAGWYRTLLEDALAHPGRPVGDLEMLSGTERAVCLVEWNGTATDFGPPTPLNELVWRQAERSPERIALVGDSGDSGNDGELSYAELRRRARLVAAYLRRLGVTPETPVALAVERSPEMIVGLLGILEAGGAWVPMDPDYPADRLRWVREDSGARVLLTQERLAARLPAGTGEVVCLDRDWPRIEALGAAPGGGGARPEGLAYVIYTSGSTGRPKGGMVEHRAIANRLLWIQSAFPLTAGDRLLQKTPYSFDASIWEIFVPLLAGACVVLAEPGGQRDNAYLLDAIARHGVTTLQLVPSQLRLFLEQDGLRAGCASLRRMFCGGEALPSVLAARLFERLEGSVSLCNLYGPTESSIDATFHPWDPCDHLPELETVPLGRPIANVQVYLLDARWKPVPPGVPGELCIGGAGLARGYRGRPDLTAERFVPHPESAVPGARLYRTGDLARHLEDGVIEFLGRIDYQVKVRGFRIELGEIEAALSRHPGVLEAVVVAREDRLVAYASPRGLEAEGASGLSAQELRAFLAESLPDPMLPSEYVVLATLPRLPSGKLDRRSLPEPERARKTVGLIAPRNATEEILAGVWAELLGLDQVGMEDDFFAVGGHSLLATQVVSRARELFGAEVKVRDLFEAPTVAGFAAAVEALQRDGQGLDARPVRPVPRDQDLPLSFPQQRLWFLDRLASGTAASIAGTAYNLPLATRLSGPLDPGVLERALGEVVRRHEVLRTTIVEKGGVPVQVIAPELRLPLPVIDLAALPDAGREAEALLLAAGQVRRPFDLAAGPLVRWALLRLDAEEHVVLATAHHIVSDGWSMGILAGELGALYGAFARGEASPLPPLPVQYADFAAWQRRWLTDEVLERELAYWRGQLAGAPHALELPLDRSRPAVRSGAGGTLPVAIPSTLAAALVELSRREGVTLFMTLASAFQALLGRWAGQDDVLIGTPVAGRNRREIEGLIGFFVNTLVLRADLAGSPPFQRLLGRARTTALDAFAHQGLPFERLVEDLGGGERDLSRSPLFQVMLAFQNVPQAGAVIPGLTLSPFPFSPEVAKFELTLTLQESEAGLLGTLEYDADLFDRSTAARLLSHLGRFLDGIAADPARRIGEIPLLAAAESHQLLVEWNDTREGYAGHRGLHELVAAQVERTPDAVAVSFEGEELSYAELARRSNRLAHRLRELGVGPEVPVAMGVERSLAMVVGLLAVLEAGGAYVPLDPDYPAERLAYMIEDSGARLLLAQRHLAPRLPLDGVHTLLLDDEAALRADGPAGRLTGGAEPGSLLYIIYTSGSTGRPKGVMVRHQGVVNRLLWAERAYPVTSSDRVLQKAPFSFDFSVWECFGPLLAGARLVLARPGGQRDGRYLARTVVEQGITLLHFVPAMLQAFLEEEGLEGCRSLRFVFSGGDALSSEVRDRFRARLPEGVLLRNQYGPTEISIDVTEWICDGDEGRRQPPIGRLIANGQAYVVDAELAPVPLGVAGELLLGGEGVARGYRGRPDLTAERFIPSTWDEAPGARLYRTGDRVRLRADGALEFLGRVDQQVKVRGYRIEPAEIEAVLLRHPGVREVAVAARQDRLALVACVVPAEGAAPPAEDLRSFARERLPEHMVPAAFVTLEALPLTPSGKVDRAALRRLETATDAGTGPAFVTPRSPAEEIVALIFAEVLRRDRVGSQDGFFDLGGHSLLATQVVSRVREAFAVDLPLRDLFEAPTVAGLAARIEQARATGTLQAPAITPVPRPGRDAVDLPLSFAQQRLWFLDLLEPGGVAYNVPLSTRLAGALDARALERALQEVVRRHEVLRTTFTDRGGLPVQVIAPELRVPLPRIDLAALPEPAREAETSRLAAAEARQPFDLVAGPLIRWVLLRLGTEEHVVLATAHHIVSDAWSMGILVRELGALYGAFRRGEAPSRPALPPLPVQYADFAVWQRRWLSGAVLERELAYWRDRLAGAAQALELPLDRPRRRPSARSGAAGTIPVVIPPSRAAALSEMSRREGATLFMTLLSAFQALLGRWSGQDDVLVGTPVAGRDRRELEGLIGFFVNTLVLRAELAGSPPFRELLGRARTTTLDAFARQALPFERVVEAVAPERDLSRSPLFQVMFAFQNVPQGGSSIPGLALSPLAVQPEVAKFELTLSLQESGAGLAGALEYDADLLDRSTAARLLSHLGRFLEEVAAAPGKPIAEVPLLAPAERHQLLAEWNTTREHGGPLCLHELVALQAERAPDALAVTSEDAQLTYGELESRARRLARRLRRLGVGPDVPVAVCCERSVDMVVALLGVWEAGGAYVPLDPSHPDERLAFLVSDALSGVERPVLLTQEALAGRFAGTAAQVLRIDTDWPQIEKESAAPLPAASAGAVPESLAYVIYTSGSTGRPKGVQVSHANGTRLFAATQAWFGFGPRDVWTVFHSYAFDFSVWELWGPLVSGGRAVLVPYWVSRSPESFHRLLVEEGVTVLDQTPSAFRQLVMLDEAGDAREGGPLALRLVIFGGEALDLAALEPWFRRHGDESPRLVNMYGITETTVHVTYRPLSWADLEAAPRSPIGVAIPDLTLHLLGSGGEPLPVGVAGEIHVGGAGLARGYLGRPELTAERFVPDPFAAWRGQPGARLYRSGDLARRLADGGLEFLGRLDHQVKIRGFRIELGEIEVALVASPGVRDAVVLVRPDRLGEMALTAYVVPAGEGATDAGALRTHLRSHLPEHMVPAGFVLLDALPLTANGKLDRKALLRLAPEADGTAGSGRAARRFVAPRTPAEEVVATIFAEVLRLDRVGVHDGFFDLGGHSLLATQVMARLRETFAVSLPLRGLFEAPTVAALAERVERARGGGITEGVVEAPPIVPVPRPHGEDGGLPLSFAQQRLWFLDRFEPGGVAYNVPLAMRLTGPLDAGTLARCLAEVVRRHEVLRTTFPERGGSPVQEIAAELPLPLPVIELGRLPEREREAEVLRLAVAQARQPFDLATGPLLRWALLRLAPEEHVMLAAAHHIVCDAWSMGVLAGELGALYAAFSRGETSPLPALPVQYADFAAWQRRWLAGARLEWELAYWRQRLAGAPQALDLPLDRPRGAVRGRRGESVPVLLSPSLNAALNELARSEGATLFMTLLSAFQALLGRWSGQDDLLVGTPVAGRGRRELEGLIGFFVNTLVLRADLAGAPSFRELLQRARTAALDAFAHQDLPFERLVEAVAPERDLSRSPLFQVMFALQNVPVEGIAMPGLTLSPIELDPGVAKFELTLALREEEGGLVGSLEYDADLFDGSTAALLLSHLTRFLEAVAADPGQKIDAVPLLVPAERQQLLANLAGGLARRTPRDTVAPAARLFVAPRTPAEEVVATIFAEVLRLERVGVHDRFFDLGGHSLLAMQVTSRLRDTFAVELPLRDLFEAPTVAALAERVERARGGGGTEGVVAAPPIVPVPRPHGEDSALPLSFAQQRLWFLDRFEPGGFAYNVPLAMRLAGPLDAGTLARCLDEVVRRHEVLRTTFAERGGSPVQVIAAELALPLPVIDLGRLPEREREAEVRRLAVAQARQPFDLAAGPLLRWALLRLASEEHVMLATAHHIVSDAWSMGVLAGELGALYAAFSRGEASPLPALPVQYADFAAWQRRWLAGARLEWELAYWRQRLAGAPRALDLPLDRPRGEVRGRHGESVPVLLSPSLTAALTELARSEGATLFMTLLSAFQALLGRWSGQDDVLVGTPVAGRSRRELEGLIGFFVNTLVLRADLAGAPPFRELLQRARVTALDAFAHQELPFEQLVEAVAPERDLSRSPLFQVMFALQNVPVERIAIPGLTLSPIPLEPGVAKFELTLALREEEGGLAGSLEYDADLFDGSTAALLLTHLTGFLEAVAADPGQKIDEVPLLVPAERQQLLANLAGGLARRTPRDTAAPAAARPFVAPRTPAEEIVAAVFAEVLRLERVGADDRFFDLGGHSLLAMQVMSRLRETLAVELPVRDLFEAPAVSALAERVERARAARRAAPVVPVPRPQGEDSGLPLSFSQQRLWFLERLAPGGVAYNVPLSTRMSGPLDAQALERALAEVVRRHEVLRTTFAERDGSPVQVIASELRVPLPLIDLGALPEPAREAEAVRLATVQARRPFDLATGPLVRWVLLRLETEEHVVLAAAHHIVSDAWSMGILVGELGALYTAFSRGEGSPLPPLPVQYADFAVWQRRWLEGEVLERELAYWRERLAGAPQALELPLDRPRPAVRSGAGGTLPAVIPAALTAALSELSRREGATLFMTLTSAFQALLGRWAGQDDVLIGTPVAGRNRREIEGLIGFFVNTLVLRAELAGSPPFHELLGRARTTTLDAFAHQALPFERLVEAVAPERDLTRSPLFQVMFAFQNVPQGGTGIPGLKLSPLPVDLEVAKFELMLTLAESAGGLAGTLEYDADLFDRSTAARLLSHLGRFLEAVASDPACRIGEVPLLDPAERHQLLVEWNDSGEDHAGGMCLHELVGAQVERSPDAVAVSFEGEELSYAELERRANRLAWRLRELGVGPEVPVAMCVERSPAMVVGLLAVLKAGGAYVPLDPDYPAERLAYMIEDSGASLLLAQSHLVLRLPAGDTRVLLLDGEEADSAFAPGAPEERPLGGAVPDSLLYIIYTSGSTGRPKGVMVRHRGVVNRLLWAERAYPVTAADRVLQKAPFSFDFSVWECFGPLLAGARLVLARPGGQREGRYLARTVLEQGITLLHFVPAMLQVFLEEEGLESCHSLRFVFSGGDALSSEVRDRFRARLPEGVLLRNQYGPTEISIDMTEWVCDAGDETGEGRRQPPIGRPIGNGEAYVVDAELAPVPVGVAGELLLGGEGVARGYRGRPDLTAERFIPSARHGAAGARLYRTGDRARWRPDGNLEFLGRVDQQVKIRGYRIEPGEIESVLLAHPAVREVAVAVRERGDRHLVACVVPAGEADLAPDELRSFARERLPEYMVPARFLVLEALPLTPSGKVDRRALAALELSAEHQARTLVLPRTPVEETLAAIWKELLGVEEIGVEDSFFDLGGHSLLATRLFSRVQHAFGVDLSLRQIFHAPTIAALAQAVEEQLPPPEPTAVDLDRLLDQLEMLSDEEVAARLAELGGLDGGTPGG